MKAAARSLQGRLVLLTLATTAVLWVAVALATWTDARHELDELLDGHLAQAAALLVAQQIAAPDDEDHTIDAPRLHRYSPKVAFQVFHEGRLALRSVERAACAHGGARCGVSQRFSNRGIGFRPLARVRCRGLGRATCRCMWPSR